MTARAYQALDHRFVLDAPDAVVAAFGDGLLIPPGVEEATSELIRVTATDDGWVLSTGTDPDMPGSPGRVLAATLEYVNRRAAMSLDGWLPLHAAAVRLDDGRCIALAGRSGSGKSTLGAAALLAGWGLLAEEIAAVDSSTLAVRPYHRPIGLRRGGAAALGISYPDDPMFADVYPWSIPPEARAFDGQLMGIALVHRGDGHSSVEPVEPARGLAELVEHTVIPDDSRVVEGFRALERVVRAVPVVRLDYDTPADGVGLLDDLAALIRLARD